MLSVNKYCQHVSLGSLFLLLATNVQAELVWSDEFDNGNSPDASLRGYDLGAGGWGNSEIQEYTSEAANVRVENGLLIISAQEQIKRGNRKRFL